jgi:hypothetical protein
MKIHEQSNLMKFCFCIVPYLVPHVVLAVWLSRVKFLFEEWLDTLKSLDFVVVFRIRDVLIRIRILLFSTWL